MLPQLLVVRPGVVCRNERVGGVADGHYHEIDVEDGIGAFDRHRATAAGGVGFAQFHLEAFHAP